jgi:peptide/nickel transport system substrate-binding protein
MEGVNPIDDSNISIKTIPSLEVGFIIFNFSNTILRSKEMRLALSEAIDSQIFVDLAFGFAKPAAQFVSSGVFGFNPNIKKIVYDLDGAKEKAGRLLDQSIEINEISFDYPESLEAVGQYIQQQFKELGIDVILNPLSDADLQEKIISGDSDMYYLGWKCELGDAQDFFDSIIHSRDLKRNFGQFNAANYKNEKVDKLIESSRQNLDIKLRLADLQEIMRIISEDDIVGIPLFESDTIFAYLKKLQFEPRVDGYMHADEVK